MWGTPGFIRNHAAQLEQPLARRFVVKRLDQRLIELRYDFLGRALGANSAFQALTWYSGSPASLVVGTSGNAGERSGVAMP